MMTSNTKQAIQVVLKHLLIC